MKKGLYAYTLLLVLLTACTGNQPAQQADTPFDTVPQLVTQIRKTSKLYTAEYHIHKIITHDDELQLKGTIMQQDFAVTLPAGKRKVAIPMDATLKAYVDFSNFSEKDVRREGQHITLLLPDPVIEITSTKINHKDIHQHVAFIREDFTDEELADYEQQGRASIANSIAQTGLTEQARESAAHVIIPLVVQMGFQEQNITIEFQKARTNEKTTPTHHSKR